MVKYDHFMIDALSNGGTAYKNWQCIANIHTRFCQINPLGAEAQNEPLPLSDFTETDSVILGTSTLSAPNLIGAGLIVSGI